MNAKFTLLGTGGWIPTTRRETTCALLSPPGAPCTSDPATGRAAPPETGVAPPREPGRRCICRCLRSNTK